MLSSLVLRSCKISLVPIARCLTKAARNQIVAVPSCFAVSVAYPQVNNNRNYAHKSPKNISVQSPANRLRTKSRNYSQKSGTYDLKRFEEYWLNQESDDQIQDAINFIFHKTVPANAESITRTSPSGEEEEALLFQFKSGIRPISKSDPFTSSHQIGLVTMDPSHSEPSESEIMSMKILGVGLIYTKIPNRLDTLKNALKQALALNPYLSEAYYQMGRLLVSQAQLEAALPFLQRCAELSPRYLLGLSDLSALYIMLGRHQEALGVIEDGLKISPNSTVFLYNKGICLQSLKEFRSATLPFEKAVKIILDQEKLLTRDGMESSSSTIVNLESIILALCNCYSTIGEHEKSANYISILIDRHPHEARYYVILGGSLMQLEKMTDAIEAFSSAIKYEPEHLDANINLGMLLFETGKPSESIKYLETAIRVDPDQYQLICDIGVVYCHLGDYMKTIYFMEKAIQMKSEAWNVAAPFLGLCYYHSKQLEKADAAFMKAIELNSKAVEPHYYLGKIKQLQNKQDEALLHFRNAYKATIQATDLPIQQAFQLLNEGHVAEFRNALKTFIGTEFNMMRIGDRNILAGGVQSQAHQTTRLQGILVNLATLLKETERVKDAIVVYETILEAAPKYATAHYNLGVLYFQHGHEEKAIQCFGTAVECDPSMIQPKIELAQLFSNRGNHQKVLDLLEPIAINHKDIHPNVQHLIGISHLELQHLPQAQKAFTKAVQIDPSFVESYKGLAVVYLEIGRPEDALAVTKQGLEQEPSHEGLMMHHAMALRKLKRSNEAESVMIQCLKANPESAVGYLYLADILESTRSQTPEMKERIRQLKERAQYLDPALKHATIKH